MADGPSLERVYLIVGTDELKRKTALHRLRSRLDPSCSIFNLEELVATQTEAKGLLASLDTLPVGDTMRLVMVSEAEHMPKDVSEAIVTYLANPNPTSVLVLSAEKLARNTRLYKAIAAAGKRTIVDCAPKKRWELPVQVVRMAAVRGVSMDQDAAHELVARVGESTTLLDAQVTTLCELCGKTRRIDIATVEKHVVRVAEVRPWDFLDALCARQSAKALELYGLMRNPSHIALVAMIASRMRELICAQSLALRGQPSLLAKELGKQAWQVKNHQGWARGFAPGELEASLTQCALTDAALKGGADADTSFTKLVLFICGVGSQGLRTVDRSIRRP